MKIFNFIKEIWVRTDNFLKAKTFFGGAPTSGEPLKFEDFDFSKFSQTSDSNGFQKEDNTRRIGWVSVISFILFSVSAQFDYFDYYNLGYISFGIFLFTILLWLFRKVE